jgi:asparaginyl-tRNA synthetase
MKALPEESVMSRGPADLRTHLSSPRTRAALTIQAAALAAAREYLSGRGFAELLPPLIGPVTDPGVRGAKQLDVDYYGHRYKLMTSIILYKQAALLTFDKIFYVAPNIRLEPLETAATDRHLVEFHQLDVEAVGASCEEIMNVAEGLVGHVVRRVLATCGSPLDQVGRDPAALARAVSSHFDRLDHEAAVKRLHALGYQQNPDTEIEWEGEALLSNGYEQPFFITGYPKGSRGFYDRESPDRPGTLENFDLLLPEGYGELSSGSKRESDYRRIITRIRETGENPAKYDWYLDLLREGLPDSAGFGIGVERLSRYLAGLAAIWEAVAFPKLAGVKAP